MGYHLKVYHHLGLVPSLHPSNSTHRLQTMSSFRTNKICNSHNKTFHLRNYGRSRRLAHNRCNSLQTTLRICLPISSNDSSRSILRMPPNCNRCNWHNSSNSNSRRTKRDNLVPNILLHITSNPPRIGLSSRKLDNQRLKLLNLIPVGRSLIQFNISQPIRCSRR